MKYRSDKEEKFDNIYKTYANDIYKICVYFTKDETVAKDIMQQTFIEFYDIFENVNPDCMFAYLVCTAKNLVCTYQKNCKL